MAKTVPDSAAGPALLGVTHGQNREASTAATSVLSPLGSAVTLGAAAGLLAGLVDGLIALLAGFNGDQPAFLVYAMALAATVGAAFGGLVGGWSLLRRVLLRRYPPLRRPWVASALAGLPLLLFA